MLWHDTAAEFKDRESTWGFLPLLHEASQMGGMNPLYNKILMYVKHIIG